MLTQFTLAVGTMLLAVGISGCGHSRVETDSTLHGDMKLEMHIQGPTIKYDGVFVSEKLFDRVKEGKTGTDWLIAVLGEPTSKAELRDGSEIWKWSYRPLEQGVSVVTLFGGGSKDQPQPQPSSAFVRIQGATVVEKWRD